MIPKIFLALALLLGAALVCAQSDAQEPAPADTTQQPGTGAEPDSGSAGDQATSPQRAPSDYRPSEQISEDLSVSFPVDI